LKAGEVMMPPWTERPTEVANLLNPAFIGALLRTAVKTYVSEAHKGMPFEAAFLILPFCLHSPTARRLPARATSTPLHAWLQREENRDVLVGLGERASALVPYTKEALLFASLRRMIVFDDDGRLQPGEANLRGITSYRNAGEEVKQALRRAKFTGQWFALAGTTETIFTILGVRP
jgi:hypothetical protein